jgi:ribosome maturation factor RimP
VSDDIRKQIFYGGQRGRKSELLMAQIEFARLSGKTIAVGTLDQASMADRISKRFPGTLCEVRGDTFLVLHFRKPKTKQ